MNWSRVKKPLSKPIGWWYHKILCEYGYFIYQYNVSENMMLKGNSMYYKHLDLLCKYGFNLYGEKI